MTTHGRYLQTAPNTWHDRVLDQPVYWHPSTRRYTTWHQGVLFESQGHGWQAVQYVRIPAASARPASTGIPPMLVFFATALIIFGVGAGLGKPGIGFLFGCISVAYFAAMDKLHQSHPLIWGAVVGGAVASAVSRHRR